MSARSTKQNYAIKQLQHAIQGGKILAPDKAKDNAQTSILSETANLWLLRKDIVKAMVNGLAPAIASGDVKLGASDAKDLVESADALAMELMRLECQEVEDINSLTGGSRSKGFEYLSALLGVERKAPVDATALENQPTLIQAPAGA